MLQIGQKLQGTQSFNLIKIILKEKQFRQRISSGKGSLNYTKAETADDDDDDYKNDTFESESSEEVGEKNGSNPSETGTYTVDKEDDSQPSTPKARTRVRLDYVTILNRILKLNFKF